MQVHIDDGLNCGYHWLVINFYDEMEREIFVVKNNEKSRCFT